MTLEGLHRLGLNVAGAAYLVLVLQLLWLRWRRGADWGHSVWTPLAAGVSVLWAWAPAAAGLDELVHNAPLSQILDALRYGCWLAMLLQVLQRCRPDAMRGALQARIEWLAVVALVSFALVKADPLAFTVLSVMGLVLIEQLYRALDEDSSWAFKPAFLALMGIFAFDFYLFSESTIFKGQHPDSWGARGYVQALMVPLLIMFAGRQQTQGGAATMRVSRQLVFHTVTLTLAGMYLLFIAGLGYYVRFFGGNWGKVLQVGLVFVGLIGLMALALSGTLRAKLRVWLSKNLFQYRYDYREEWLSFTRALSTHRSPEDLNQQVIRSLADMVESPGGALWMRDLSGGRIHQVAKWNSPAVDVDEPMDATLTQFLQQTGWVINLSEFRQHPENYEGLWLPPWLVNLPQAWLLVPLKVGQDLIGFVVLANSRTTWELDWEVIDLLKTASSQAAGVLAQMQATAALLESQKFESFNRMSAFVVHDLKNIVTQLSLMMKNARRLKDNPEFQEDMLMTVENALERMRQLMLQLREGGAPAGGGAGVDLSAIATDWAQVARKRAREVTLTLQPGVTARGHDERLRRVVGHLIQNALDATDIQGGRVAVSTLRYGSHACLTVEDNGVGMSEEFIKNRLFKPFQTTKQSGMGIGAYESAQYIQELGGKLEVHSREGEGTRITLTLPLLDMAAPVDVQGSSAT